MCSGKQVADTKNTQGEWLIILKKKSEVAVVPRDQVSRRVLHVHV